MKEGEKLLHKKYSDLHTSKSVEHEQKRRKRAGQETSQKPADKIADFLDVIERTHGHEDPAVLERIKESYHKEYVIKQEDILDDKSYWNTQRKIIREEGRSGDFERDKVGEIILSDEIKDQLAGVVISNQERSLDKWIDYLSSEDATYPAWAKYWAFKSIVRMGKFEKLDEDKENNNNEDGKRRGARFTKRTKDTITSFPILNPRALAMTISVLKSRLEEKQKPKKDRGDIENISKKLSDQEFKNLLSTEDFSRLYAQFLVELPEYSTEGLQDIRGEWKKYAQGSNPTELVNSLDGYPLEWCTADYDTAEGQLKGGDFYVYYSNNESDEAIIPRLAIRMEDNRIAEPPRGIAPDQNLDPHIGDVLEEKLTEFGSEADAFKKRLSDMKYLTEIDEKEKLEEALTKDDLRFIYEIDSKIQGFGYQKDPRIKEIQEQRNIKKDLALIIGCAEHEISITEEEALNNDIKYHYGDFDLRSLTSTEGLKLPESIGGDLDLRNLTSAEGLKLPESVSGYLNLGGLTSAEHLKLPESVGGGLNLENLTSAEHLKLPESVGDSLYLRSLTSAEHLKLPESVGGYLNLGGLTSAEHLKLPESVGGGLNLENLTSAEHLKLPESVGDSLYLGGLTSAEKEKLKSQYPQLRIV